MNGEIEQGEPTSEAGPVETAREIYTQYAQVVAGDRFSTRQTSELVNEAENHEAAALTHARLCADLGFPERTVGFLERSSLPEADKLGLLAQA